ncbi:MAG: FtsH protease activity modulator HflK, partial [Spirochaetes bacterium]|nr:FtsH protease activity modulator HflK [Spirochaetota bacterium]
MADNVVKLRKLSRGFILLIIIAVAVLIGLLSSFYQIQPGYEVIILRLGKRQRQVIDPGLHWKLPFGVETIIREKINEIRTIEFGYRTERSGVQTVFSTQAFPDVSLLITGDLNIADVKWAVRYEISDLYKY